MSTGGTREGGWSAGSGARLGSARRLTSLPCAAEMNKWRNVTIVAVPFCVGLMAYNLSKHHDHMEQRPYPYMQKRQKPFPWGNDNLFDILGGKKEH